jgi:SpoVK/Ycf46/Vps4 family AAA+-type ATPase
MSNEVNKEFLYEFLTKEFNKCETAFNDGNFELSNALASSVLETYNSYRIDDQQIRELIQKYMVIKKGGKVTMRNINSNSNNDSSARRDENKSKKTAVDLRVNSLRFNSAEFVGMMRERKEFYTQLIYANVFQGLYTRADAILMYGPPGGGKTYLARALANSLKEYLFPDDEAAPVQFYAPTPGDIRGSYVGETERNLLEWFQIAQKSADDSENNAAVSILFFDEMESVGGRRGTKDIFGAKSTEQLLLLMGGAGAQYKQVVVIGATNLPWSLDPGTLRRFQRKIFVDLPGRNTRMALFVKAFKEKFDNIDEIMSNNSEVLEMFKALTSMSGMSPKGKNIIEEKIKSLITKSPEQSADWNNKLVSYFEDGNHKPQPEAQSPYGYSNSAIQSFVRSVINKMATNKLSKVGSYMQADNTYISCVPICLSEKCNDPVCDLDTETKNQIKFDENDLISCVEFIKKDFQYFGTDVDQDVFHNKPKTSKVCA